MTATFSGAVEPRAARASACGNPEISDHAFDCVERHWPILGAAVARGFAGCGQIRPVTAGKGLRSTIRFQTRFESLFASQAVVFGLRMVTINSRIFAAIRARRAQAAPWAQSEDATG